jgi:hypothetical protein
MPRLEDDDAPGRGASKSNASDADEAKAGERKSEGSDAGGRPSGDTTIIDKVLVSGGTRVPPMGIGLRFSGSEPFLMVVCGRVSRS